MRCSCKLTLVGFRVRLFVGRNGWTTESYSSVMARKVSLFSGLVTSRIGSSKTRGERDGVKTDTTAFVGATACAEWTRWCLRWRREWPKSMSYSLWFFFLHIWLYMFEISCYRVYIVVPNLFLFIFSNMHVNCRELFKRVVRFYYESKSQFVDLTLSSFILN